VQAKLNALFWVQMNGMAQSGMWNDASRQTEGQFINNNGKAWK
jgi:hypothetical protein